MNYPDIPSPVSATFAFSQVEHDLRRLQRSYPVSFRELTAAGHRMTLAPAELAVLLETVELRDRGLVNRSRQTALIES